MPQELDGGMPDIIARTTPDDAAKIVKHVKSRQSQLETVRRQWEEGWHDISQHLFPLREDVDQNDTSGKRQGTEIYDGTGQAAHMVLTDGLFGHLINPAIRWMKFRMRDKLLDESRAVRIWLDDVEEHMYGIFNDSTFYDDMHMFFQDYTGWCTSYMNIEPDIKTGEILFVTLHPGQMYISSDVYGRTDVVHRKVKLQARQAAQLFGKNKLSTTQQQMCDNSPFQECGEFLHAIYPRDNYDARRLDKLNMPWAEVWVNLQAEQEEKALVRHSGRRTMPIVTGRYKRSGREEYGRGPGFDALIDMMILNGLGRVQIGIAEKSLEPPMAIHASQKGRTNFEPRGDNYFVNQEEIPKPIDTVGNYSIGLDREEQKREAIRRHFHVDFFLMLQGAERQMTAEEVMQRQSERATVLGPMVGRATKTLDNIMNRVYDIEMERGNLPPLPPELEDMPGAKIDVVYLGPLAQQQRKLFQIHGLSSAMGDIAPWIQVAPDIMDNIDTDMAVRETFEANGVPQRLLRSVENREAIRAGRQASQDAAEQMALMNASGEVTKKMAEADAISGGQLHAASAGLAEASGGGI